MVTPRAGAGSSSADAAARASAAACTRSSRCKASAFKSCSMVRSPAINVVWRKCCAAPMAVDTVPSIPFNPRFESTHRRLSCLVMNVSMARTLIEAAENRHDPAGESSSTRRT